MEMAQRGVIAKSFDEAKHFTKDVRAFLGSLFTFLYLLFYIFYILIIYSEVVSGF